MLSESLVAPHAVEIKQLGFALKVDLAIALGAIGDRPVFLGLNRLRNRFAHDRNALFTYKDASDYFNAWSPQVRSLAGRTEVIPDTQPIDLLSEAILVLAVLLRQRILSCARDQKAHARISHEIDASDHRSSTQTGEGGLRRQVRGGVRPEAPRRCSRRPERARPPISRKGLQGHHAPSRRARNVGCCATSAGPHEPRGLRGVAPTWGSEPYRCLAALEGRRDAYS